MFNALFMASVTQQRLPSLEEDLCKLDSSDSAIISEIIDKYSQQPNLKENSAYLRLVVTLLCFQQSLRVPLSVSLLSLT